MSAFGVPRNPLFSPSALRDGAGRRQQGTIWRSTAAWEPAQPGAQDLSFPLGPRFLVGLGVLCGDRFWPHGNSLLNPCSRETNPFSSAKRMIANGLPQSFGIPC